MKQNDLEDNFIVCFMESAFHDSLQLVSQPFFNMGFFNILNFSIKLDLIGVVLKIEKRIRHGFTLLVSIVDTIDRGWSLNFRLFSMVDLKRKLNS